MSDGSDSPPAGWYANPGGQRQWWDGSRWTDAYEDTPPSAVATDAEHTPERGTGNGPLKSRSRRLIWAFAFAPLLAVAAQAVLFQADIEPDSSWWRIAVPVGAAVLLMVIAVADLARLPPIRSDKSWGVIWAFLFPGYPAWRARATSTSYAPFAAWLLILAFSVAASGFLINAAEERAVAANAIDLSGPDTSGPDRFDQAGPDPGWQHAERRVRGCVYELTRLRAAFNNQAERYEQRYDGRPWTIKGAETRKASGEADPADRRLIKAYYAIWRELTDPRCYSTEEVERAREVLRNR